MRSLLREGAFLLRIPAAVAALSVLALLSCVAVILGLQEVARQTAAVERVIAAQDADTAAVQEYAKDAGYAAYSRFHATWSAPGPLAFAALGQRDVAPAMLRIRALALEGQIHESEAFNPELVLPGRFDFAFVLVYLAPLVVIALLHDLWSGEREAGRAALLSAMPRSAWRVWGGRATVRIALVAAALLIPVAIAAIVSGAGVVQILAVAGLVLGLLLFWAAIALLIGRLGWRSATNAASLSAVWFIATLILPTAAGLAVNALVPIPQGAELVRENREAVHDAWDLDRNATLARFYQSHPEWAGSKPMTRPFHWKWYFAFQQLGDEHVAALSAAYDAGIRRREALADRLGWVLPPVGVQRALHALAGTDMTGQLAYQDRVRAYHERLRRFYYPYLFADRPFTPEDWGRVPGYGDRAGAGR